MTMEDKQLQSKQQKMNVVKKKMKRVRGDNALWPYTIAVTVRRELPAEEKPTKTIWDWIKEKFW